MKKKSVRLSPEILPLEYDITLRPDLHNFTFEGIETVTINLKKPAKVITLHSKELEIETAEILVGGPARNATHSVAGREKIFAKISYNLKEETATFTFPKTLEARPKELVKLTIVFKGILNDKMRGFYKSSYDLGGKTHHLATTQFEATDARRAFPCFDEPAHKAVFHVSLVIPKGKTAISNTLPVSVKEHEAGFEIVRFSPTPKMSTYLLAFIVGDFEFLEKKSKNGVIVRIYTIPGKKHLAKFSLDVTAKVLDFFEEYFDIPYPLNTLDMIAIPDFASLAMENWGAITFREIGLLVDEANTSTSSKELIAEVIAHELAHQWFGNLVTMEWWTHLWLNEGFASYIPYIVLDKLFPKWNVWELFNTQTLSIALRLDSLKNTHPIEVEVHHPNEIGEIFDEVSYSKGASVIRMLADYLGEKDFRDGLRYYLKKHSYKNTETIHLWEAFEKISKKPVARMMENWTGKPGYPVVTTTMKNGKINFSQKRFFSSPISSRKSKDKTIWEMPLNYKKNKVNYGEAGFFRTAYSKELLEKLFEPVQKRTLSVLDRLGIVRDLFALSEAGIIPTSDALEFLTAYKNETDFPVWAELAMGLGRLEQILAKEKSKEELNKLIISLFSPVLSRMGWEKKGEEYHTCAFLRSLAIARLGRSGDKKTIEKAKKYWEKIKKGEHVNPDLRGAIYSVIASSGGKKEYDALQKKYRQESLHEEKNRIGNALGDFRDPKILSSVCEFAMSSYVRPQDTMSILSGVGINPMGRDIWWNFVTKNWKTLASRYGEGGHQLARLVKAIAASAEQKHLTQFKKFFSTHDAPGATRSVEQVLERLESNIAWLTRDGKAIAKFLKP